MINKTLTITLLLAASMCAQSRNPLITAGRIADQIIRETSFTLTETSQKPADEVQVIDFNSAAEKIRADNIKAAANIIADENKTLQFGVSYNSPVKIVINDNIVFTGKEGKNFIFKEIAYSVYAFQDTFRIELHKGLNKIIIEPGAGKRPVVYLREIAGAELPVVSKFLPVDSPEVNYTWPSSY